MKTTIEVPDALAAQAKRLARERHITLRELVVSGLRAEIERHTEAGDPAPFRFHTVDGSGLRPEAVGRSVTSLAYDLPD